MEDNFNAEKIIHHWKISSNRNYQTMRHLLETKDNNWALFLGHLVLEKLLKAHYVKNLRKHSIFTHDLLRLASKTNLNLTEEVEEWLDEISTFNLNVRYDNYKEDFQKLCTNEYTEFWIEKIEIVREWLIKEL